MNTALLVIKKWNKTNYLHILSDVLTIYADKIVYTEEKENLRTKRSEEFESEGNYYETTSQVKDAMDAFDVYKHFIIQIFE